MFRIAVGMVLQQNLFNSVGLLIVPKGHELTFQWVERLKGLSKLGVIGRKVKVWMPKLVSIDPFQMHLSGPLHALSSDVHEKAFHAASFEPDFKLTHYSLSGFLRCVLRFALAIRSIDRFSRKLSA